MFILHPKQDKRPPSLYLIFDHEEDTDDGKMKFMYEIMEFASKVMQCFFKCSISLQTTELLEIIAYDISFTNIIYEIRQGQNINKQVTTT